MSTPRTLLEFMDKMDASTPSAMAAPRRATSARQSAPVELPDTPPDVSFEFSAAVSYSSASPASAVFSDGQLRAHQFPVVVKSTMSSPAGSPPSSMSAMTMVAGSKKRVTFAPAGTPATSPARNAARKKGGLLGCMGSACGLSRDGVVEPAKTGNPKIAAI